MAGVNEAGVVQSEASTGGAEYLRPLPRVTSCNSPHPPFSTRLESPPPPTRHHHYPPPSSSYSIFTSSYVTPGLSFSLKPPRLLAATQDKWPREILTAWAGIVTYDRRRGYPRPRISTAISARVRVPTHHPRHACNNDARRPRGNEPACNPDWIRPINLCDWTTTRTFPLFDEKEKERKRGKERGRERERHFSEGRVGHCASADRAIHL